MNNLQKKMNHNSFTEILTKKDAKNEAEYQEPSVIHNVLSYFNIFECGKNILNRLDVTYEQACMSTPKDNYYTKLLVNLVDYNDHHNVSLSNKKLRQAISTDMTET